MAGDRRASRIVLQVREPNGADLLPTQKVLLQETAGYNLKKVRCTSRPWKRGLPCGAAVAPPSRIPDFLKAGDIAGAPAGDHLAQRARASRSPKLMPCLLAVLPRPHAGDVHRLRGAAPTVLG